MGGIVGVVTPCRHLLSFVHSYGLDNMFRNNLLANVRVSICRSAQDLYGYNVAATYGFRFRVLFRS